jgi:hypothetical protein
MINMGVVKQTPSPNYSPTPIVHDKVFLHRTEGPTAEGADAWLCQKAADASTHLISNADGSITYQLVPLQFEAWAQCSFNRQGISIEYPGYTAQGVPEATLRAMALHTAWLLRAYGIPCQHAKGGQGRGYCMHHDLGAAGGNHTDVCGVEDATWQKLEGYVKEAYDAFGDGPLPPWALHGAPAPHAVELPPDVAPEPSHGGALRVDPASPPAEHPTVSGYPAGSVADLQWRLNKAGATPALAVDGHAGPLTRNAIAAFQGKHRLSVDGQIGPKTWAALEGASA